MISVWKSAQPVSQLFHHSTHQSPPREMKTKGEAIRLTGKKKKEEIKKRWRSGGGWKSWRGK